MCRALFTGVLAVVLAKHVLAMPSAASGGAARAVTRASRTFMAPGDAPDGFPSVDEARGSIGGCLYDIKAQANGTLNALNDQVLEGTQKAIGLLNTLRDAAASEGAEDGIGSIETKMLVLIVDMQDMVPAAQDQVMDEVGKQISAFTSLGDKVDDSFRAAGQKVEACCGAEAAALARRAGNSFWPFPWGGHKKNAFEQAEDAIAAAHEKVVDIVEALDGLNVSAVGTMNGLVLSKLEVASAQFQEKCMIAVAALSDTLPEITALQTINVCTAIGSMMPDLASRVDAYAQFVSKRITAAQHSFQALFALADTLMGRVLDARDAADAAAL